MELLVYTLDIVPHTGVSSVSKAKSYLPGNYILILSKAFNNLGEIYEVELYCDAFLMF